MKRHLPTNSSTTGTTPNTDSSPIEPLDTAVAAAAAVASDEMDISTSDVDTTPLDGDGGDRGRDSAGALNVSCMSVEEDGGGRKDVDPRVAGDAESDEDPGRVSDGEVRICDAR